MSSSGLKHRLAAIFAADAAGYSRMMAADERATVAALEAARSVFREKIETNHGRVVDMAGDSVLAVFDTGTGATAAASAVQEVLEGASASTPENRRLRFRIGIQLGDIMEKADGTVYGDGVNVAARLQALANPGEIVVSDAVQAALRNRIAAEFEDRGKHRVKNISHPVHAYTLRIASKSSVTAEISADSIVAGKPTIAVLPFANMSGDPAHQHFGDGIAEDIITDLSKISGLAVMGRQSAFSYAGKPIDRRQIARELAVRYLLEGSVRMSSGRLRVNAQLIEAETGTHLWANRYDRELGDMFLIGDEITEDIVTSLDVRLARGEDARVYRKALETPEARETFMRGIDALSRLSGNNLRIARDCFLRTVELEPNAYAYGMLGYTYVMELVTGWRDDVETVLATIESFAQRALELDESYAGGHFMRAYLALFNGRYDEALRAGTRGLECKPMCAGTSSALAYMELYAGTPALAKRHAQDAITLNPIFPGWYLYVAAAAEYFGGRGEQALTTVERALAVAPGLALAKILRVAVLSDLGRIEQARAAATEVCEDHPDLSRQRFIATQPFKDAAQRERYLTRLREAGLFAS